MSNLQFSEIASKSFKMNIFSEINNTIETKLIAKQIFKTNTDIFILEIDYQNIDELNKLNKIGFKYIQTAAFVSYTTNILKYNNLPSEQQLLSFTELNSQLINKLTNDSPDFFNFHSNPFQTNPFIDKKRIPIFYSNHFLSTINEGNTKSFLIKTDSYNEAIVKLTIDGYEKGNCEILSNRPNYKPNNETFNFIKFLAQNEGLEDLTITTCINNLSLQNLLISDGFVLKQSKAIIHINALLSYSKLSPLKWHFIITENEIKKYGEVSGDLNPIHFNDEFAKKSGFKSKIAHGLISNSIMSKYFGTIFPGVGTIFMNYEYLFFKPIYPNNNYSVEITFPSHKKEIGYYLALVKIIDDEGSLCLLSYNGLIKRT